MHETRQQAELLDRFLDDLAREPLAAAPGEMDAELADLARTVALVERGVTPAPAAGGAARARVWQQALAGARSGAVRAPRRRAWHWRRWSLPRPRLPRLGASALKAAGVVVAILLVLGIGLQASPRVRAGTDRLACLVPRLGIRGCDAQGLVAAGPVADSRGGATLRVTQILSSGGETIVRLEITGLPATFGNVSAQRADRARVRAEEVRLTLRDGTGRAYPPAFIRMMRLLDETSGRGAPFTFRAEWVAGALDPGARAVDVLVEGPAPVDAWQVRVPLVPLRDAALPTREGGGEMTLHGVTVRVANVAADPESTVVQLAASVGRPARVVRLSPHLQEQLVLRDDRGREYRQLPSVGLNSRNEGDVHISSLLFPPLAPDARAAELILPGVTVEEQTGPASLRVPLADLRFGARTPLAVDLVLGPYPLRVTGAELVEGRRGDRQLLLHFDLGGGHEGPQLIGVGQVTLDGRDAGLGYQYSLGSSNVTGGVNVSLPEQAGEEVTVTFRNAHVALEGPWTLAVPVLREP